MESLSAHWWSLSRDNDISKTLNYKRASDIASLYVRQRLTPDGVAALQRNDLKLPVSDFTHLRRSGETETLNSTHKPYYGALR